MNNILVLSINSLFFTFILLAISPTSTAKISPSESRILLHLQQTLEYPNTLNSWNQWTDLCNLPYSPTLTVVCSNDGHVTELTVIGTKTLPNSPSSPDKFSISNQTLSSKFSIDSLFTDLSKLPSMKKLSLISLGIWGRLPSKISRFQSLETLNISSNYLFGELPSTISSLNKLKTLDLSSNMINGSIPDMKELKNLQQIDMSNNQIGPNFPSLGTSLVSVILKNNSIRSKMPSQLKKLDRLQKIDVSSNKLIGPIPTFIFSLPALWYVNLGDNKLTGQFPSSTNCGKRLWFVDISRNLLVGNLPNCLGEESSKYRRVLSEWNCLSSMRFQHKGSFCERQALAVIPPVGKSDGNDDQNNNNNNNNNNVGIKVALIFGLVAGTLLVVGTVGLLFCICKRRLSDDESCNYDSSNKSIFGGKSSSTITRPSPPKFDMKYVSRSARLPVMGLPQYHDFTLAELEEATNNFDSVNLVVTDSDSEVYKGLLASGSAVLVKCIKVRDKQSSKSLKQNVEGISQLRHHNLVSTLGHCVVTYQDRHKGSTIYIVLEHVTNGSLREHLTDWRRKDKLKWPQRLTISMGIGRGVHFLHTGSTPGVFGNDLRIENILLDESLTPKISNYKIPLPIKAETPNGRNPSTSANPDKDDIYNLGLILIELVTGTQITSETQLNELKKQLERSLAESASALQHAVDLSMRGTYAYQSIKTAVEVTLSCLSKEPRKRPPMEDVLWHLEYSVQAQQAWTTSGNLAFNSGNLGLQK